MLIRAHRALPRPDRRGPSMQKVKCLGRSALDCKGGASGISQQQPLRMPVAYRRERCCTAGIRQDPLDICWRACGLSACSPQVRRSPPCSMAGYVRRVRARAETCEICCQTEIEAGASWITALTVRPRVWDGLGEIDAQAGHAIPVSQVTPQGTACGPPQRLGHAALFDQCRGKGQMTCARRPRQEFQRGIFLDEQTMAQPIGHSRAPWGRRTEAKPWWQSVAVRRRRQTA